MKLYLKEDSWIDTEEALDISMPLSNDDKNPRAWYVDEPRFEPVRANGYVGSVAEGGSVNFRDIFFNPHGHGTHTECLGHITEEVYSVNQCVKSFFCKALLISIEPEEYIVGTQADRIVQLNQLEDHIPEEGTEAIIIRTLPNDPSKCHRDYSSSNPPYLNEACISFFDRYNIRHLIIDTPSVDREEDGGVLAFHHAYWKVPENPDFNRTITELAYIPDHINDGTYILELQLAPFENDASPSRPVLYRICD